MRVDLPLISCAKTWKLKEGITTSLLTLPTKLMVSPLGREGVTKGRVDYFDDLTLKETMELSWQVQQGWIGGSSNPQSRGSPHKR